MTKKDKEQLVRIMQGLQCSEQEALEILEYDKKVDKGEKTEYDLTEEQQKVVKKMCQADRKKKVITEDKPKTFKSDAIKEGIIDSIVRNCGFEVKVINPAQKILINGTYEMTLSATKTNAEKKRYRPDAEKEKIISGIAAVLEAEKFIVDIINPTRQIDFMAGESKYRITLIKKTK